MMRTVTELKLVPRVAQGSVTRTVRIDREVDDKLVTLAEKEKLSTNFLVNRALRRHVEWEAYADSFGFMSVPSAVMAKVFSCLTEEQAKELGAWAGENKLAEMVNFWFKKLDLHSSLKVLDLLGSQHGRAFKFESSFDGRTHTLILKHDAGPRASAYYAQQLKGLFARLGNKIETMETDGQVVAKIYS